MDNLQDERILPIFIHSELDDLGLDVYEFRVYAHLARRAGSNKKAWPSYNTIGEKCFRGTYPKASSQTLRRKAIKAVRDLTEKGLVRKVVNKKKDGQHGSNNYFLTDKNAWGVVLPQHQGGGVTAPGGGVTAPKGTPKVFEGNPKSLSPNVDREYVPEEIQLPEKRERDFDNKTNSNSKAKPNPEIQEVIRLYEQVIGTTVTPLLIEAVERDLKKYPAGWIPKALEQSRGRGARSWSYVAKVLEGWQVNGLPAEKGKSTGTSSMPEDVKHREGKNTLTIIGGEEYAF